MTRRLVLVDRDADMLGTLEKSLTAEKYEITATDTGICLEDALADRHYDLALISADTPDIAPLIRRIRTRFDTAIIISSSRNRLAEIIANQELLADDYIVKPFLMSELLARIHRTLRNRAGRGLALPPTNLEKLQFSGWTLDIASQTLRDENGHAVALTTGEYRLLETFARHCGHVLSRTQLTALLHTHNACTYDRSIDVAIMRLRRKLGDETANPRLIKTIRGGGYLFTASVTART